MDATPFVPPPGIDWYQIKARYEGSDVTPAELASEFDVDAGLIGVKVRRQNWHRIRRAAAPQAPPLGQSKTATEVRPTNATESGGKELGTISGEIVDAVGSVLLPQRKKVVSRSKAEAGHPRPVEAWELIETSFRAGETDLSKLATAFNVSATQIAGRAHSEKWMCVPFEQTDDARRLALALAEAGDSLDTVISVRASHQMAIGRQSHQVGQLTAEFKFATENRELLVEFADLCDTSGPDENGRWKSDLAMQALRDSLSLSTRVRTLQMLVKLLAQTIKRQPAEDGPDKRDPREHMGEDFEELRRHFEQAIKRSESRMAADEPNKDT